MNEEAVLYTHTKVFYRALKPQDFDSLRKLYSEDYMLVRPDGSVLSKEQVLGDLDAGGLIFYSIELTDARVRIHGKTALVTGESRTVTSRENKRTTTHFRFIAVYVDHESTLQLTHFQSVTLPD